mmetsp:Transcript_150961/g.262979  ORF Transcript_150961/g.262979 Transcript_150961/m.262979 type:complete len:238 (-) Transcript_150961:135-848(-)
MRAFLAKTEEDPEEYEEEEDEEIVDREIEKPEILDKQGMPEAGPYGNVNPIAAYTIMEAVAAVLFTLIAWGIYALSADHYKPKVQILHQYNLGYVYIAAYVLNLTLSMQQMVVAKHRALSKASNPDQYIFKTMLKDDPYVRLETKGPIGKFNRSQRGIDNTRDIFPQTLMFLLLSGFVFSEAALVLAFLFMVGGVLYSCGYVNATDSRGPGMLIRFIAQYTLMGITIFIGIMALIEE